MAIQHIRNRAGRRKTLESTMLGTRTQTAKI